MKLVVLVPSQEYKSWAGARIRYHRIQGDLAESGVEISLEDIATYDPRTADCDAVCISKCHDPKSLVVAAIMSSRGKFVGIDLFDDYFSDMADSRLVRYRSWLGAIIESCDFALCSTVPMSDVVRQFRSDLPTHVLNDPAVNNDLDRLAGLIRKKQGNVRASKHLNVAWFGIGNNAYFPIGLADLSAYGALLNDLSCSGMDVQLTILTNRRALNAEGLSFISRLPVRALVTEWSEEAERRVLEEALLVFIPVNAQNFSVAKSLNRAVTALSAGCQVLSVGYPLYQALDQFIYRDPATFLRDLGEGALRLSDDSMANYAERMTALASAPAEAQRLAAFLSGLEHSNRPQGGALNLVHGHSTRIDAHSLVKETGGFSVASPFCSAALDFDVVFRARPFGLEMLVSRTAARRFVPGTSARLHARRIIGGKEYRLVRHGPEASAVCGGASEAHARPLPVQFATYETTMRQIHHLMSETFGPVRTIVSETSRLPFQSKPSHR